MSADREDIGDPYRRLSERGLQLPAAPSARGLYQPAVLDADRLVLGAHGPVALDGSGGFSHTGRVGWEIDLETAVEAARIVAVNMLATAHSALGDLRRVERVLEVTGYVNATREFMDHAVVVDGASRLLVDVFGRAGEHARTAVGVASLPFAVPVVISMTARVRLATFGLTGTS